MIALNFALLLLVAPVVSQQESDPQVRQLWWNNFWNKAVNWFKNIGKKTVEVLDVLQVDVHFPKLFEAVEEVIKHATRTFEQLGESIGFVIDNATSSWKDITEGLSGDAIAQIMQLIKNIDDLVDCRFYTFEMLMDVKCDIDRQAFIAALVAVHSEFSPQVTLVDMGGCQDGTQALEVEWDIDVTTDLGKANIEKFEKALEEFKPLETDALKEFLTAEQPDAALSVEPSFCEVFEEGKQEFQDATKSVEELTKEVAELVEAAKEEGTKNAGAVWKFFQRFINIFKKDPVQEKLEQKKAELEKAKKVQSHGANAVMGASEMCNNGEMRGPLKKADNERICPVDSGRRLARRILV